MATMNGIDSPIVGGLASLSDTRLLRGDGTSPITTATSIESDFVFISNTSGETRLFQVSNSQNASSSAAQIMSVVAGGSAGDPMFQSIVFGALTWTFGADNSDSDAYKIASSTDLGTNTRVAITGAGNISFPSTSAFLVTRSSTVTNATGDGTTYKVPFNSTITDQNTNWSTDTFTAPITEKYSFDLNIKLANLGAAHTRCIIAIVTTARYFEVMDFNAANLRDSSNNCNMAAGIRNVPMTAGDTAYVNVTVYNSTKTVTVYGDGTTLSTYFSGRLSS